MITSSATLTPYQIPSSHYIPHRVEERSVHDLPWITRAVNSQVTIPLEKFFNTLLPEHTLTSDAHIEEMIRECSGPDMKKSFAHLFATFTKILARRDVDGGLPGDGASADRRVPDSALVEIDFEGKNTGFNGAYYAEEGRYKSVWHLLAKRASDAFSTGIPRNHIYGVYVKQEYGYFLYYDHSSVIVSEPTNWVKEPHSFWKAIYVVSKLPLDRIGCTALKFIDFPALRISINDLRFQFTDVVHSSEHILGEGTSLIHARVLSDGPWKDEVVTIRFNFVPKAKGWKEEEVVVSDIRGKVPALAAFLPVIITSKVFESSAIEGEVRKLLGDEYRSRELRVTVYRGQLFPVTTLDNDLEILTVFRDVMRVLHGMYWGHWLSHRSLNPSKILFQKTGNKIRGVLTGFELCAHLDFVDDDRSAPSCLEALESSPFMSSDALNNTRWSTDVAQDSHRRDLESVYYILLFIVKHYDNGKRCPEIKPPFDVWFGDDKSLSASSKTRHIFTENPHLKCTPSLANLGDKVKKLHYRLISGYIMRNDYGGEEDDIFICVNYNYFCEDLFQYIP